MKLITLFLTSLSLFLSTANAIHGQASNGKETADKPVVTSIPDESTGTPPFQAQLLLIQSDWSQVDGADAIEADMREALKDMPASRDLLLASGPKALFPLDSVQLYKIERYRQLFGWLAKHGLVARRVDFPQAKSVSPQAEGQCMASLSERLEFLPIPPTVEHQPFSEPHVESRWQIANELGRIGVAWKLIVAQQMWGQGAPLVAAPRQLVVSYDLPKGYVGLTHAFPGSEEIFRHEAWKAGVVALIAVAKPPFPNGGQLQELRLCLPDRVERSSVEDLRYAHKAPTVFRSPAVQLTGLPPSPEKGVQPPANGQVTRVFHLRTADANSLAKMLTQLFREDAAIVADQRKNALVVRGPQLLVTEIGELVERIDVKNEAKTSGISVAAGYSEGTERAAEEVNAGLPTAPAMIEQLRESYESNERIAGEIAAELRDVGGSKADAARSAARRQQLRRQVADSFAIRQQLHEAELANLEWKLEQARETIDQRNRIKAQIIDRRVEDLLNPNHRWEAENLPTPDSASPSNPEQTIESTGSMQYPRSVTVRNLTRLMVAMYEYCDVHEHFPPAVILGKDGTGKVPHSWRVELLPFLGQQELYDQYHFDEAWDSEHNKSLLAKMPAVFRSPLDEPDSANSSYFGVVADVLKPRPKGMCFLWPSDGARLWDIRDGTKHTIALVEAKRDIPWTKPVDIAYQADRPLPKFGGWFADGFHAGYADGTVKFVLAGNDERTIRNLLTISDLERFEPRAVDCIPKDDPLEFRILPNLVEAGRQPSLSDEEFARYRHQLAKGDMARPLHGDGYCWREIESSIGDIPFTAKRNDRSYVLTSFLDRMLLWGELKGRFRVTGVGGEMGGEMPEVLSSLDLEFDDEVADKLRRLTRANLNNRMAIVVCGKVVMAPTIRDEFGGAVKITGVFSPDEITRVLEALQAAADSDDGTDNPSAATLGQTAPPATDQSPATKPHALDTLYLAVTGPSTARVGQKVQFNAVVKNTGREDQTARIFVASDSCLKPISATPHYTIENDRLIWQLDALPAGGTISRHVEFECTDHQRNAEIRCYVVLSDKSEMTTRTLITIHDDDAP